MSFDVRRADAMQTLKMDHGPRHVFHDLSSAQSLGGSWPVDGHCCNMGPLLKQKGMKALSILSFFIHVQKPGPQVILEHFLN